MATTFKMDQAEKAARSLSNRSLSDSVDIADVAQHAGACVSASTAADAGGDGGGRPRPGWLDSLHPRTEQEQRAAETSMRPGRAELSQTPFRGLMGTPSSQQRGDTPSTITPGTSRYPADLTVTGSPAGDMDIDDSDNQIRALMAQLGNASPAARSPVSARADGNPVPRRETPQPTPQPAPARSSPLRSPQLRGSPPPRTSSPHTQRVGSGALVVAGGLTSPRPAGSTAYTSHTMQALSQVEGATAVSASQLSHPTSVSARGRSSSGGGSRRSGSRHRGTSLYENAMRAKLAKQQWISLEQARQRVLEEARIERDCPFHPTVSKYAARINRPPALRPEQRAHAEVLRRKQWIAMKQREEVEKELEECTFRPLTLRTVRAAPTELAQTSPRVFRELYREAEARQHFEQVVRPQVVDQLERRLTRRDTSPLPPERLQEIVERLFSKAVVREEARAEEQRRAEPEHRPTLSAATLRIIQDKIRAGERDPDIVSHLYQVERDRALEAALAERIQQEQERLARSAFAEACARERRRLVEDRVEALLVAKFQTLAKEACALRGHTYRVMDAQPVVGLARASLNVLSPEEAEEVLNVVESVEQDRLTSAQFVRAVLVFLQNNGVEAAHHLLIEAPTPPLSAVQKRASAERFTDPLTTSPQPLPKVKRERPDPAVLQQVREKREAQLAQWREEAELRKALEDGLLPDAEHTFQPAPRRLIPYECRPDVHIPVKTTKADALRRAHNLNKRHASQGPLLTEAVAAAPVPSATSPPPLGPLQLRQQPPAQAPAPVHLSQSTKARTGDAAHTVKSASNTRALTARVLFDEAAVPAADGTARAASVTGARQRSASAAGSRASPRNQSEVVRVEPPVGPQTMAERAASQPLTTAAGEGEPRGAPKAAGSPSSPAALTRGAAVEGDESPDRARLSLAPKGAGKPITASTAPSVRGPSGQPDKRTAAVPRPTAATPPPTERLYRDVISEHAAYGGEAALTQLGRELLLRQLREHQRKRHA